MAIANIDQKCSICNEENETYHCNGCKKSLCITHLLEHREKIKQDFHEIEHNYNVFQQNILDKKARPNQHLLINKIDQWEKDSIEKIKQTAEECRQRLIKYVIEIEDKSTDLFEQLKKMSKANKFNEIDLEELKKQLNKLQEGLDRPSDVSIKQKTSAEFINMIYIATSLIDEDTKWKPNAITVAGGNGQGNQLNQLNCPYGICIDENKTIYIADHANHRIIEWKSNATHGRIIAGGNGKGNQKNQLSVPKDVIIDKINKSLIISDQGNQRVVEWSLERNTNNGQVIISNIECSGLTIDKNGDIYVCNYKKHEVTRWKRGENEGIVVAGGNGKGNQPDQLSCPQYIFVDDNLSLYVSDYENHRIMKWMKDAKEGIIVAGGNGNGSSLTQLSSPLGLMVDQLDRIYVADCWNHRIMRWPEGDKQGTIVVGRNGQGDQLNQLNYPTDISFAAQGNLYVSDESNHRVQMFEIA